MMSHRIHMDACRQQGSHSAGPVRSAATARLRRAWVGPILARPSIRTIRPWALPQTNVPALRRRSKWITTQLRQWDSCNRF